MADEKKEEIRPEPEDASPESTPAESEAAPKPAGEPVDVDSLKVKARERDEFLELLKRTAADFSNYRKRMERDRAEWTARAVGEFVAKLLPVLDDLDRAVSAAEQAPDAKTMLQGFLQIRQKLTDLLKAAGVESFEPHGEPFDPGEHDALIVEETDELPHDHVSEVVQKGWRLRDRILRPAQVKVARKKPKEAPGEAKPGDKGE